MVDRFAQRNLLEHAVDKIRPMLARLKPARPMTLPRLLFLPIEHLLVDPKSFHATDFAINRTTLAAILELAEAALGQQQMAEFAKQTAGMGLTDAKAIGVQGQKIWPAVGRALLDAVDPESSTTDLAEPLKDQLRYAGLLLVVADLVHDGWSALPPPPLGDLTPHQQRQLVDLLGRVEEQNRDSFEQVLFSFALRARQPARLLGLLTQPQVGARQINRLAIAQNLVHQFTNRCDRELTRLASAQLTHQAMVEETEALFFGARMLAELARQLKLKPYNLSSLEIDLREHMLKQLHRMMAEYYPRTIDDLDHEDLADETVEAIERQNGAIERLRLLCHRVSPKETEQLIERFQVMAAQELRSRYGANAPMIVLIDQLRNFEMVFGSYPTRKLWAVFHQRLKDVDRDW